MRYTEVLNGAFYLGRVGDNLTNTLVIDVSGWKASYGDGMFSVLHQRYGDTAPYPCGGVTYDATDETLRWPITNADVANVGKGELQLYYTVNGAVVRSEIFITVTQRSLGDTTDPPEPWESWVEEILQAAEDAETARDEAEEAQEAAEEAQEGAEAAEYAIENMQVAANTLETGEPATVTKSTVPTESGDVYKLTFGLPKGNTGDSGVYIGATEPTDPVKNVWINPNDVANRGYVPAGGTTGQVLKKASGTDFDTEWGDGSSGGSSVFIATYGTSTATEVATAITANKAVICYYERTSNDKHWLYLVDETDGKYVFAESSVSTGDNSTALSGIAVALNKATNAWEVTTGGASVPTFPATITNDRFLHTNASTGALEWSTVGICESIAFTNTAPTDANTDGLKVAVLTSEPATKYDGWIYIIIED